LRDVEHAESDCISALIDQDEKSGRKTMNGIQSIAFITYAVTDIPAARRFYEGLLGLKLTHEAFGQWFEYNIGDTTFALSQADTDHPVPVRGAVLAFEVADLDAEVARLEKLGATFKSGIGETPVCRIAVVMDPDGSEIMLHQKKRREPEN
jgi:predicted enzyme related to lactoylglutathione lyase